MDGCLKCDSPVKEVGADFTKDIILVRSDCYRAVHVVPFFRAALVGSKFKL